MEGRASTGLALDPDPAAVGLDDLLADGQARAGPFVLFAGVQPPEELEDLVVERDSIPIPLSLTKMATPRPDAATVPRRLSTRGFGFLLYFRPLPTRFARSWPIRSRSPQSGRKRALDSDLGLFRAEQLGKVGLDHLDDLVEVNLFEVGRDLAGPGERQEILDQGAEPPRGLDQVADILLAGLVELVGLVAHQEVGEGDQGPERLLDVVRDDIA